MHVNGFMDFIIRNGVSEPETCECGGKMINIADDLWQCELCGYECYKDNDGDYVSESYDE